MTVDRQALITAGFKPTTYTGQEGEYLRVDGVVEQFPYAREHVIDGDFIHEGMSAIFEIVPDGTIQFHIPDADYVERYELTSEEGQGLLKDAMAGTNAQQRSRPACDRP